MNIIACDTKECPNQLLFELSYHSFKFLYIRLHLLSIITIESYLTNFNNLGAEFLNTTDTPNFNEITDYTMRESTPQLFSLSGSNFYQIMINILIFLSL